MVYTVPRRFEKLKQTYSKSSGLCVWRCAYVRVEVVVTLIAYWETSADL